MGEYIIKDTIYKTNKSNLLCVGYISKPGLIVDIQAVTKKLYYPKGKAFIMETMGEFDARPQVEILTESEAKNFLDSFSSGIVIKNYIKLLGKPKEL